MLFLPDNAVLIQVVPFGGIDKFARLDFGNPSAGMNIRYLEYKIMVNESSLSQQYSSDDPILKHPESYKGWNAVQSIYLDKQNVTIDLDRENMEYDTIFARSFSRKEQKKMGRRGAFMGCFVVAFTVYSHDADQNIIPIIHNFTNSKSQVYELNGDIRIQGNSSTIFIISSTLTQQQHNITSWTTTPYARKNDNLAMKKAKKFKIIHQTPQTAPACSRKFDIPTIVFSTGGYAGNHFHDFTDLLIPLYLTSHQFDKKVIFLVSDKRSWWTSKYRAILENLSKYKIIYIDDETHQVLCFSRMTVGLKAHKELGIDSSEPPHYSMTDFRRFLRRTYSLDREFVNITIHNRPKLLIVSRRKTRHLTNEGEVADMARRLGFEVVVQEMGWQVSQVAKFVNGFDVMVGVHGRGLPTWFSFLKTES
ncbi:hypothetical protein DH2020_038582 [Rehmannia glutinosa]|uniref:Glycosyltransferase 61 catalytic domain-containing protein n=1 Tax=Rehmannia glutinosa TaxID=99300 RepID=A0ABR0UZC2_REHGL